MKAAAASRRCYSITPEALGLRRHAGSDDLVIRSPEDSAHKIRAILARRVELPSSARDIVLANTAAALWVAGTASDLPEGVRRATEALDSGAAEKTLDRLIALSHAPA